MIKRTTCYQPLIFYVSLFAVAWAIGLLYAGAYTTSIQAGMAFLDWPLSNSSINPAGWLTQEDMRAEHSHRLLGASFGLIALLLILITQLREGRRWVRVLAISFFVVVLAQGIVGGLRVLLDQLNTGAASNSVGQTFCVLHAAGAQITVCVLATLTLATSRFWFKLSQHQAPISASTRTCGLLAIGALFIQIMLGAIMRHSGAGMAIPTFPLTPEGSLLPSLWSFPITIHWLHRLGAVVATVAIGIFIGKLMRTPHTRRCLGGVTLVVIALLGSQIVLGAATIWTQKNPAIASTHTLVGAFLLTSTWVLTFATYRLPVTPHGLDDSPSQVKANLPKEPSLHSIAP